MADKILNTRILLKYDSYANWTSNNPVLKAGEMAVATVAAEQTATGFTNLPNVVIKVGDGTSHYNDLKFVSALAADVHGWAKKADKPSYTYTEIEGLLDYVGNTATSKDTNTKYALVATNADNYKYELRSQEIGGEWKKEADLDLSGLVSRIAALEGKFAGMEQATVVAHVQAAIQALDAAKVEAGTGEVIGAIEEVDGVVVATKKTLAKEDIPTIEQSQVNGLPKALTDLNTAVTNGDAATLASAKEYSDAQLKTVKEALDYNGGAFGDHKFATKIVENDGVIEATYAQPQIADIAGLETRLTEIEGNAGDLGNDKQDVLGWDPAAKAYNKDTNPAATVDSVVSRIGALDYTGGSFGTNKFVTKVTQEDGVVAAEYAQPAIADINGLSGEISRLDGRIDTKQDALTFTPVNGIAEPNATDNRVATEKYVLDAVADLNGAMHFVGKVDAVPSDNKDFSAGDVILVGYDEYVFDGTNWLPLGNESIYQTKELANQQHEAMTKAVNDLTTKHNEEMEALEEKHDKELAALDAKYDGAIKALDKADTAVAGQFVTAVSEADGVITVSRDVLKASDIPELAQSQITGLVDKLAKLEQDITNAESGALDDANDYTDGKIDEAIKALDAPKVEFGQSKILASIEQNDGVIVAVPRDLAVADIPVLPQSKVENVTTDIAAAKKAGEDAAAQALVDANKYTDDTKTALVAALKNTDAAVAQHFVTEVKQADGIVSVQRAEVAKIALSGSTDDLVQGTMTLVFNCGNSQVGTANEFANL